MNRPQAADDDKDGEQIAVQAIPLFFLQEGQADVAEIPLVHDRRPGKEDEAEIHDIAHPRQDGIESRRRQRRRIVVDAIGLGQQDDNTCRTANEEGIDKDFHDAVKALPYGVVDLGRRMEDRR